MRHNLFLGAILAGLWLVNSGHYTPLLLGLGALSVALVLLVAKRMDLLDKEAQPIQIAPRIPLYWLWLVWQIVLANIDVVKRIWQGVDAIDPQVADLPLKTEDDILKVTYANSITLTPGTVTLNITEDTIRVHALTAAGIASLKSGAMEARVVQLER